MALKITEGQARDGRSAADMLGGLGAGQILLGEWAYDSDALRGQMAEQGAWANVRPMPNRNPVRACSPFLYKYCNLVERFFSKRKHARAVATEAPAGERSSRPNAPSPAAGREFGLRLW